MRAKNALAMLAVAALAAIAGIAFHQWNENRQREQAPRLFSQPLRDLTGASKTLAEWRGKVLVVNFWATWCEPCREEIPMFVRLQREHGDKGLQFIGIAIDDPAKVAPFAKQFGINYPVLLGGIEAADWSRTLGNQAGGLPFTLIVGRDGVVRGSHLGAMKEGDVLPYIRSLL